MRCQDGPEALVRDREANGGIFRADPERKPGVATRERRSVFRDMRAADDAKAAADDAKALEVTDPTPHPGRADLGL